MGTVIFKADDESESSAPPSIKSTQLSVGNGMWKAGFIPLPLGQVDPSTNHGLPTTEDKPPPFALVNSPIYPSKSISLVTCSWEPSWIAPEIVTAFPPRAVSGLCIYFCFCTDHIISQPLLCFSYLLSGLWSPSLHK